VEAKCHDQVTSDSDRSSVDFCDLVVSKHKLHFSYFFLELSLLPRDSLLLLTLSFTYCVMQSFGGPPHAFIQLVKCL